MNQNAERGLRRLLAFRLGSQFSKVEGGLRRGTRRIDPPRAPLLRSAARRPCEANLHTQGRLKLQRQGQGGASWGVNTQNPASVRAPELLTRGPGRGWGKRG